MSESEVGRPVVLAAGLPVHLGMLAGRMLAAEGWSLVEVDGIERLRDRIGTLRPRHVWWGPDVDAVHVQGLLADLGYTGGASPIPVPLGREVMLASLGPAAAPPVLDGPRLDRLAQDLGGEMAVTELAELFLASLDERWDEAESAWATGDTEVAHRSVHTLKSAAALVGLAQLSAVCAGLERAALGSHVEGGAGPADHRGARERARAALEEWLRGVRGPRQDVGEAGGSKR